MQDADLVSRTLAWVGAVIAAGNTYRGPLPVPVFVLVLVGGILLAVFVPLGIVFATIRRRYAPGARVLHAYEPAEATITRRWQTGVRGNRRFGIGLELEVHRAGYPAYRAQARALVGIFDAARFEVGAVLPVRVDPDRPERVYIETRSEA